MGTIPQEMKRKELILHINTSNFTEACLVYSRKLNVRGKWFALKDLTSSQGCAAGKLFRVCPVLLMAKLSPCSLWTGTSLMEKTRFFSPSASPICSFNESSGAMVNCPESQEQAWWGQGGWVRTDEPASVSQGELCNDSLMNVFKGRR